MERLDQKIQTLWFDHAKSHCGVHFLVYLAQNMSLIFIFDVVLFLLINMRPDTTEVQEINLVK